MLCVLYYILHVYNRLVYKLIFHDGISELSRPWTCAYVIIYNFLS